MKANTLYFSLSLLMLLFFASCGKEEPEFDDAVPYTGEWRWIRSYGGFNGILEKSPASTGNSYHLKIYDDSQYLESINGQAGALERYERVDVQSVYTGGTETGFKFYGMTTNILIPNITLFMEMQGNDTIHFRDNCVDCFEHLFVREN